MKWDNLCESVLSIVEYIICKSIVLSMIQNEQQYYQIINYFFSENYFLKMGTPLEALSKYMRTRS